MPMLRPHHVEEDVSYGRKIRQYAKFYFLTHRLQMAGDCGLLYDLP